jgi:hypothetical protein
MTSLENILQAFSQEEDAECYWNIVFIYISLNF